MTGGVLDSKEAASGRVAGWPALAFVAAASSVLLGSVLFMHYSWDVPMGTLTQDPLFHQPVHVGFLSQAGILMWAAAAGVSLAVAAVLGARGESGGLQRFFLAAGVLTLVLCLDDAFMLHDVVLPDHLGVPEEIVYAGYAGLMLLFLGVFYKRILTTHYLVLALAFAFFALSILADMRELPGLDPFLLEDGAKAIGIVSWLAYFFQEGTAALR